jgi:hypothetical protein
VARAVGGPSLDWLSYVLFGDPMSRPYRPTEGDGYAVVERIGAEIEAPISPGSSARFRASLRRTPPAWHEERVIEVTRELRYEEPQLRVLTFGLEVRPDPVIDLVRTPDGDYLGWFTLTAPAAARGQDEIVQLHFCDGERSMHSLTFGQPVGEPVPA